MKQQINLFQPIFRTPRPLFSARAMAQIVGVVLLAIAGVHAYGTWQVTHLRQHLAQLGELRDRELTRLEHANAQHPPRQSNPLLKAALAQSGDALARAHRLAAALNTGTFGNTTGFSAHLAGLARQRVEGTWLTRVSVAAGGDAIAVAGEAMRPELVPALVRRLAAEPAFAGKTFGSLKLAQQAATEPGDEDSTGTVVPASIHFEIQSEATTAVAAGAPSAVDAQASLLGPR